MLCASEVILAEGLSALSLESVRLRAEVSGSQIAHYFHDKPTLVRAVLDRQIDMVMAIHRRPEVGNLGSWHDWQQWIDLNVRHIRQFDYCGRPTYHGLAGQLVKVDDATRAAVANGYERWIAFFEQRLSRMQARGVLTAAADPHQLALVVVGGHLGGCLLSFAYRQGWPLADAVGFIVNHLRRFATDPAERRPRRPPRAPDRPAIVGALTARQAEMRLTRKGLATRARIVDGAADLMFEHGARRTSLEHVRSALEVSGSQLSHYFAGKSDLTRQIIAARSAAIDDFLMQPEFGGLATLESLRSWAIACGLEAESIYLRGGCPFGSLVSELAEAEESITEQLIAGYNQWLQRLRGGLTAMRRSGELTSRGDVHHLAVSLVIAHQGGAMLAFTIGSAQASADLVMAAVDYIAVFQRDVTI